MNYHQERKITFVDGSNKFDFDVYNQDGLKHFRKHDKVNFMERTNEWIKTQENKGTFIHRQEYTVNGRAYVVDGKHVKLNPSNREMSIAVLLSEKYGKKVELIPQVMYPQSIQTPDYLIDGERYDLKSPIGSGKKQAESLYKSQRTGFLETIVFLKNGEVVKVLSRN